MKKSNLIGAVVAVFIGLLAAPVLTATSAQAESRCDVQTGVCELFLEQQNKPAFDGPLKPTTEPMRCVYVASNEATALVLRNGVGTNGEALTSWRKSAISWRDGMVNARAVKIAQVCFPVRLLASDAVTLCGEIGHSIWRGKNIEFVRENNVDKFDPACVGGSGWCGYRGL